MNVNDIPPGVNPPDDFNTLIDARPDNIFVLKLTYWLSR